MLARLIDALRANPSIYAPLAGIGASIGARYGLDLSADQITAVFGAVLFAASIVVRQVVWAPTTVEAMLEVDDPADAEGGDDDEEAPA